MCRRATTLTLSFFLIHAVAHVSAARSPGDIATSIGGIHIIQGIPVCPVGLPACGLHGCYTQLLSKCDPAAGCISVKILSQLSSFVRFGSSSSHPHAGACPVPFANKCGDQFCGMGEVCSAGRCQHTHPQQEQFVAHKWVGNSIPGAMAACIAARQSSSPCASDTSNMTQVECNAIGVASLSGIYCFQSAQFNCGVQPGNSATFTCRGLAGVAQTVGEVWNSTITTAAKVAEEMAEDWQIAKREQQQAAAAARAKAGRGSPLVLAGPVVSSSSSSKHSGSSSSSHGDRLHRSSGGDGSIVGANGQQWANAALGAVRDQPFFQNLAHMVSNATHSLLNKTADGVVSVAESAKSAFGVGRQTTFDLGPPPIKDAAAGLTTHTLMMLLVAVLSVTLLGM